MFSFAVRGEDWNPQGECWYRYEEVRYAPSLNEYDEPCGSSRTELQMRHFFVKKHTPKGVWLAYSPDGAPFRFVLKDSRKRFACPTKKEALESYLARKRAQIRIYEARLSGYRKALQLGEDRMVGFA
jgi:hypothetical protein